MRVWFGLVWASEEAKGAPLGRQREGGTGVAAAPCPSPGVLGQAGTGTHVTYLLGLDNIIKS